MIHTTLVCLVLSVLCLPTRLLLFASGHEVINIRVLQGHNDGQCPSVEESKRVRNEIHQLTGLVIANFGKYSCGGTPGWRRVTYINMTNTSYSCPTGLNLTSYSKRTCGRSHTTGTGCSSTTFNVGGLPYSQVCGRIRGYQFGATGAFQTSSVGIESYYVSGISLTHGGSGHRQHIWTFAAGLTERTGAYPIHGCPCDTSLYNRVPSFVGNNYFCESGFHSVWIFDNILYSTDPLWDGQNCTADSTCCQLNNPPWFTTNLPDYTTNDIELRICTQYRPAAEDTALEFMELYVQ